MRGYVVVVEGDDASGYSAYSPDIPGVVAAADDRREVEELIREAMAEHLTLLREIGHTVPEPGEVAAITVVGPSAA
jgi:predicted RNase H-like HicB family nuclease